MKFDNVALRPIRYDDLENLNRWKNDPEVFDYLGGGYSPVSIDEQKAWMDSMICLTGPNKRFIIESDEDNAIGVIGLYNINMLHRTAELGIYIGEHTQRGKGFAKKAYKCIETYAINYLNLRKIKLLVVDLNVVSRSMWMKNGYSEVGCYRLERYINGQFHNVIIMEKFLGELEVDING